MKVLVAQICWDCETEKPISDFGVVRRNPSGYNSMCKDCNRDRTRKMRLERPEREKKLQRQRIDAHRERINKIKLDAGCADCGYNKHAVALDFDHLPGFEKKGAISNRSKFSSWEQIEAEIAKCEVVCSNCHRVRTANRRK